MVFLLIDEAILYSKFSTLGLVAFTVCFATYIVVRMTRAHSASMALKITFSLFAVLLWLGYRSYTGNFYKIEANSKTFKLYFPKSNPSYVSTDAIKSIMPRFGKSGCLIIVRTDSETFTSTEVTAELCKEISSKLKSTLISTP